MSPSGNRLKIEDFKKIEQIGKGGFGVVYIVRGLARSYKNKEFALKEIPNKKGNEERVQSEINTLRTLNSRQGNGRNKIVTYYDWFADECNTYILMEYCKEGSLRQYINKRRHMDNHKAADVIGQLVQGISFIHSCQIAHRDLTTGNVLISVIRDDGCLSVKIADFGLTKSVPKRPIPQTFVGTPGYIAPEVMGRGVYNESADVFSLGCILYMMLVGIDPERVKYETDGTPIIKNETFHKLDSDAQDLIRSLMKSEESRLRLHDIPQHPFIKRWLRSTIEKNSARSRSGSADHKRLGLPRRTSADGGGDPSGRYSSEGQAIRRRYMSDAVLPQTSSNHYGSVPRIRQYGICTKTTASEDSAFCSGNPTHEMRHFGRTMERHHYRNSRDALERMQPADIENRIPAALDERQLVASSSRASSNISMPTVKATMPRGNAILDWPIPYTTYLAREFANIGDRYVRLNNYGRFTVLDAENSAQPDVIYEMNNSKGYVEMVLRVYYCYAFGKEQIVSAQKPKQNVKIESVDQPLVERDEESRKNYRSVNDFAAASNVVQTGYRRILSYISLARNKFPRRIIRGVLAGVDIEVRYDGTISMSFADNRPSVEVRINGIKKNMESLHGVEKLVFEMYSDELLAFHKGAVAKELNLPSDMMKKKLILEMATKPSEVILKPKNRKDSKKS